MRRLLIVLALVLVPGWAAAQTCYLCYHPPSGGGSGTWDGGAFTDPAEGPAACTNPAYSFGTDTSAGLCLLAEDQPALTPNGGAIWARMLTTGLFVGHATTYDDIGLTPVNAGAGKFSGTITLADITDNRIWTFPNTTGTVCLSTDCTVDNGATTAGRILFKEDSDNGSNAVTLIGPASTADVEVTLPAAAGTLLVTPSTITGVTLGGFTASRPIVSDGSGNATVGSGFSGNTTTVVTTTGAQTNGDCVEIDANGNHIASGAACGGSGYSTKALTESAATSITQVSVASGAATGGTTEFSAVATDTTDHQSVKGRIDFACANKAGTESCTISASDVTLTTSGTLVCSYSVSTIPSNAIDIQLNCVSSLTQTSLNAYHLTTLYGPGTVTPQ